MNKLTKRYFPVVLLILIFFNASVQMGLRLPAFASPNELLNFEYVQVIRQIRGLPSRGSVDLDVRYNEWHQPPLFSFSAQSAH